jgi:putative PIN family toxin of toxin-antitoxin system
VIDTNVVVSANRVKEGPSAAIFLLAVNQRFIQMCVSPEVLTEYEEVLRRRRLKFPVSKIEDAMALIRNAARMVYPTPDAANLSRRIRQPLLRMR